VVSRLGGALSGCLVWGVLLVVGVYAGSEIGAPYYRYYRYGDVLEQQAHFATIRSDSAMMRAIWATADSLGLPDAAYQVNIRRGSNRVHLTTAYDDAWAVPGYRRTVHFQLDQSAPLL
jgi:hypothetical protein